jgi:hypothetical protein
MHKTIMNFCTTKSPFFFPSCSINVYQELHNSRSLDLFSTLRRVQDAAGPCNIYTAHYNSKCTIFFIRTLNTLELSRLNKRAQSIICYSICWIICTLVKLGYFEFSTLASF